MKKLVFSIAVLIVFVITSIIVENKLRESADNVISDIGVLASNIKEEKWDVVDKSLIELENKWEELSDKWAILVEHEEIDGITISFLKSKTYAINREKEESLAELREFEFMIDHIPKIHKVEVKNIF